LTATIACRTMSSKSTFSDMEKLSMLMDSWFTRWHSMEETKIGTKTEDAVLQALSCQELADEYYEFQFKMMEEFSGFITVIF
jgi:hypothetical protein